VLHFFVGLAAPPRPAATWEGSSVLAFAGTDLTGISPVTGRKSVGLVAAPLAEESLPCVHGVMLVPHPDNTGSVYFGGPGCTADSDATTDGCLVLPAGVTVPIEEAALLYLVASAADQQVFWAAF